MVGPTAVTATEYGVLNGIQSVPFMGPASGPVGVGAHGPEDLDQLCGGPLVMAGHGGRLIVRLVGPLGPVTSIVTGGTFMLGDGTKPKPVAWPEVTLTLE